MPGLRRHATDLTGAVTFGISSGDVRENGVYRASAAWQAGDVFRIAVSAAGAVTYARNGEVFYTSAVGAVAPLHVAVVLASPGAGLAYLDAQRRDRGNDDRTLSTGRPGSRTAAVDPTRRAAADTAGQRSGSADGGESEIPTLSASTTIHRRPRAAGTVSRRLHHPSSTITGFPSPPFPPPPCAGRRGGTVSRGHASGVEQQSRSKSARRPARRGRRRRTDNADAGPSCCGGGERRHRWRRFPIRWPRLLSSTAVSDHPARIRRSFDRVTLGCRASRCSTSYPDRDSLTARCGG